MGIEKDFRFIKNIESELPAIVNAIWMKNMTRYLTQEAVNKICSSRNVPNDKKRAWVACHKAATEEWHICQARVQSHVLEIV